MKQGCLAEVGDFYKKRNKKKVEYKVKFAVGSCKSHGYGNREKCYLKEVSPK